MVVSHQFYLFSHNMSGPGKDQGDRKKRALPSVKNFSQEKPLRKQKIHHSSKKGYFVA